MVKITSTLIKELRERTNAGIMDCKKALIEENGNIELAIENMRKYGIIKAAKKDRCKTSEGIIVIRETGDFGVLLEVNCQTDFTAKDEFFQSFSKKVLDAAVINKISEIAVLRAQFEEERIALISKIGENISIRRVAILDRNSNTLGTYRHGKRIGVLVSVKNSDKGLAKKIAMHIAASKPEFIKPKDISDEILKKEYQVHLDTVVRSGKSEEVAKKIIEGRMKKFIKEISLTEQSFIMDENKTIAQLLKENNADVNGFVRFEVGESL